MKNVEAVIDREVHASGTVLIDVPEGGDVVIRTCGPDVHAAYALRSAAGLDQLACTTRAEAERIARGFAEHFRVNVWLAGAPNEFTLLVGFRGSERTRPHVPPLTHCTTHLRSRRNRPGPNHDRTRTN